MTSPQTGSDSKPIRILHLHNLYQTHNPSGETTRVLQECEILAHAGHIPSLRVIENDRITAWSWPRRSLMLPVRTVWSNSSYAYARRAISEFRPDVVHVHNILPLASPSVYWAAVREGVAVVHTLANYRLICPAATLVRDGRPCEDCVGRKIAWPGVVHACYRRSRPASAAVAAMLGLHGTLGTWHRAVDVFLVGSEFARRKHVTGGLPADKIVVKPNTAPDPGAVRKGPGTHYLFAGRLGTEKNVAALIRAWHLAALPPSRQLHVAGKGPELEKLQRLTRDLHLTNVRFLGTIPREAVMSEIRQARALISPSIGYEVSPISIIEAFATSVPAVVPAAGAQAEIVTHHVNGLHFDAGNIDQLADALRSLEDDDLTVRLGLAARKRYETGHTAEDVLRALEEAYGTARQRAEARRSKALTGLR